MITTAALKCSGTVCCYQKQLLLCTGVLAIARQNAQTNKCYTPDLILIWFIQIGHLEKLSWSSSTPGALHFQVHNLSVSRERRFDLRISGQFNTNAVSSQQFRLTPRTVPFCDYSQVQAKYRLNIALYRPAMRRQSTVCRHLICGRATSTYPCPFLGSCDRL